MVKKHPSLFKATLRYPGYSKRQPINIAAFVLGDGLAILAAFLVADSLLYYLRGIPLQLQPSLLVIPTWWVLAYMTRLYPGWGLGAVEEIRRIVILTASVFGVVAVAVVLFEKGSVSRITYFSAFVLSFLFLPSIRAFVKTLLIQWKIWGIPVVIYADGERVRKIAEALRAEMGIGYMPIGFFSNNLPEGSAIAGLPLMGGINDHCEISSVAIIDCQDEIATGLERLLLRSMSNYRHVILIPYMVECPSLWVKPRDLQGTLGLELTHNLLDPAPRILKRWVELALVVLSMPVWFPLLVLLALLVRLEDGGFPFFLQKRRGRHGELFTVVKFRTMRTDAEKYLDERLKEDAELRAEWKSRHKLKNDPRITHIGNFLRITSLDEIPQFFNVLMGQMALVGPRPLPPYHFEQLREQTKELRNKVRPGITGLWQVSGRSESGTLGMEKWDPYYVRNWSIWLDIMILARTVRVVLRGTGAY